MRVAENENLRIVRLDCRMVVTMAELYEYFSGPVTFVHLATLCYILGLLTRNELRLRAFIMAGSGFYILYYYFIAESPLWEAIAASTLIGTASLPVIWRIFRERSTWGMSDEMLALYRSFPSFNPGQFRNMMALGEIIDQTSQTVLLKENVRPTHLYLTMSDGFKLKRNTQNAELGPGNFLGEISFLLGGEATATVIAEPGCRYVSWDVGALHAMMENSPRMANAISIQLNKDIARKLAVSFPSPTPTLPETLT